MVKSIRLPSPGPDDPMFRQPVKVGPVPSRPPPPHTLESSAGPAVSQDQASKPQERDAETGSDPS
jgi:hypothetical protein